jgi:bacterioferritin-associated ferredoxin
MRNEDRKLRPLVLYVDDEMLEKIDQIVALHKKVEKAVPIKTECTSRAGFMRQFLSEQFKKFDGKQYQEKVMSRFSNLVQNAAPEL